MAFACHGAFVARKNWLSPMICRDTTVATALDMIIGISADTLNAGNKTSAAKRTPAMGLSKMAEIAAAAGISKGTHYNHFKTKNEVFLDITQRFLDEQWEDLLRWTENKEKDTSLNRLVRYVAERDIASAGLRLQLLAEAQLGNETLRQNLTALYQNFQGLIRGKIAERTALPADFLTWLLLLVCDGIIVQESIGNAAFDREAFLTEGIRYLRKLSAAQQEND